MWPKCLKTMWAFLSLFVLCYFLESITFTYLISSVQSIERQFQISSSNSGMLISAGDIGYITTALFLAYYGGKGNRARWIGAGCMLIALACLLISMPGYIFKAPTRDAINETELFARLRIAPRMRLAGKMGERQRAMRARADDPNITVAEAAEFMEAWGATPPPALDEDVGQHAMMIGLKWKCGESNEDLLEKYLREPFPFYSMVVEETLVEKIEDRKCAEKNGLMIPEKARGRLMKYASGAMGFCNAMGNQLKEFIHEWKCREKQGNNVALSMVFIGVLLIGVGHSMPWSLGLPLIDDSVKKNNVPLYFGGLFFCRVLGPICGFVLGGVLSSVHVTLKTPPGLNQRDVRWVGAWWLGYLLIAIALFSPSLLLFFYPSESILKKHRQKHRGEDDAKKAALAKPPAYTAKNGNADSSQGLLEEKDSYRPTDASDTLVVKATSGPSTGSRIVTEIKEFLASIRDILRSPVFCLLLLGRVFDAFAFKGFFAFLPKYLVNHYGISQTMAPIYISVMGVTGFAVGIPLGAFLMRRFKFTARQAAMYSGMCGVLSASLACANLGLQCDSYVNRVGREGVAIGFNFSQPCNTGCLCDTVTLNAVCAPDGTTYFSPCAAGCDSIEVISISPMRINFHNCTCAPNADGSPGVVSQTFCTDNCGGVFTIYMVISIFGGIIAGSSVVPGMMLMLRCVDEKHRSLAMGFMAFVVSLVSTLPSPMAFGKVVDTACIKWATTCSGQQGACEIYNPDVLRTGTYTFNGALRFGGVICDIFVWYFAKSLTLHLGDPKGEADAVEDAEDTATELSPEPFV